MRFSLATLYVKNMSSSLEFYNTLLEIPILRRLPAKDGGEMVFLGVDGEPNLELISTGKDENPRGFSIGFDVENLSAIKQRLEDNGYHIFQEMKPFPTLTLCFLKGPDGETVELVEQK